MVGGEDCLSVASSAAAPDAALRPKEISGSGVAFSLVSYLLAKQKKETRLKAKRLRESCIFVKVTLIAKRLNIFNIISST